MNYDNAVALSISGDPVSIFELKLIVTMKRSMIVAQGNGSYAFIFQSCEILHSLEDFRWAGKCYHPAHDRLFRKVLVFFEF